jgi:glycosyltransferase involved in cell wall biosynthesis
MPDNKIKILFITRNRSTRGGHIVLINIIQKLRKQGFLIDLAAFKPTGEVDFPDCEDLWQKIDPHIVEIPFSNDNNEQIIYYTNAAATYLKKNYTQYDKIVLDSWHILHAAIKSKVDTSNMFHLVQSDPEFKPENSEKIWKSELFATLPLYPIKKIIVSRSLLGLFKNRYEVQSDLMELFADKIYFSTKFKVNKRKIMRFISTSGDFNSPSKGLDFLIEQLAQFKSYPFTLTLVNNGMIRKDLSGLPFSCNITSAKNPKEMSKLLADHDVYINTSTKESLCLCLVEALAVGMPAIALDSIGNRDYANNLNFIFVKNKKLFKNELAKLSDIQLRRMLSKNAKESVQKYKIENTVYQFKKIVNIT